MSDKRYEANIIRATAVEPANNLESTSAPGVWSIDEVVELKKKDKWPTVGNVVTNVEEVFSAFPYRGNGAVQVIENGIALSNANDGGSARFDSTTSRLDIASSTDFDLGTGDFTIDFFAWWGDGSQYQTVFSRGYSSGMLYQLMTDGTSTMYVNGGGFITDSTARAAGNWYQYCITRESGTVKLYVNGTLATSTTGTDNITSSDALNIGDDDNGSGYGINGGKQGFISNFRIIKGSVVTPPSGGYTSDLTAVSGTVILTCQGDTPFVDNSSSSHRITKVNTVTASEFGPFTGSSGKGGLVWIKKLNGSTTHSLVDSVRGDGKMIQSSSTDAEINNSGYAQALNSNGFRLFNWATVNTDDDRYVAWTFREKSKFFDIVQYSGTGSAQAINHNLGSTPGAIFVKQTNEARDWAVFHRQFNGGGSPQNFWMKLNDNGDLLDDNTIWNDTAPTSTQFTVGTGDYTNKSGGTYIAYLFAHNDNDGEFGPTQDQDIIKCGSYTGNGSSTYGTFQDLGFEPDFIMVKNTDLTSERWVLLDGMRGVTGYPSSNDPRLVADANNEELHGAIMQFNATGFTPLTADDKINGSGHDYIYIAIRRGPMATPTAATDVFSLVSQAGGYQANRFATTGFPVDLAINVQLSPGADKYLYDRKRGERKDLKTSSTEAEGSNSPGPIQFDFMDGVKHALYNSSNNVILSMWRRAPGFFDIAEYRGTGPASGANEQTITHNLGVKPEMLWIKKRTATENWWVFTDAIDGTNDYGYLNTDAQFGNSSNNVATSTQFSVGGVLNTSAATYVAYLFATLSGISKVGTFVADGNAQNIDCGFTSGARYVLIKKTSGTFNWRVWDTTRGIVAGDDPYYYLDTDNANTTNGDWVDPYSSGFSITSAFSNGTYLFYAIA